MTIMQILQKGRKNLVCVVSPHVDIATEKEKSSVGLSPMCVMDRLQTSGELQEKTSFIDPSTGVDLLKSCSPDYLLL